MKQTFKTFAVTLTALSTISFGTVLANPDAAEHLSSWYKASYQKAADEAGKSLKEYADSILPALAAEQQTLTDSANSTISKHADSIFLKKFSQITVHSSTYLKQLWDKTDYLTGNGEYSSNGSRINQDFDLFISSKNNEVNTYINDQAESFIDEITNELDGIAEDSSAAISSQKSTSVKELEAEISNTKMEIEELLAEEQKASTAEMKTNLDEQIASKKSEIIEHTQELEELLEKKFLNEGSTIEGEAIVTMEQVVNTIN